MSMATLFARFWPKRTRSTASLDGAPGKTSHPLTLMISPSSQPLGMALACITVCLPSLARADRLPSKKASTLTLERIFTKEEFKSKSFSLQWIKNDSRYTFLKESKEGAHEGSKEIWIAWPGKGKRKLLVAADALVPEGDDDPLKISRYSFSDDLTLVLIYTNSKRVWRSNSRGDYWVLNRKENTLHQLGGEESKPSSLMFAKLSPDGRHAAYVRGPNIFLENLADHTIRALTESTSKTIFNGRFDWVYEEELGIRDGFRWSPDSMAIAYWQFDEQGVRKQILVDYTDRLYPKETKFGYPKVGQRNAACQVGVVEVANGKTTWIQVPGDPREHYLARMEWAESSEELVVQQLNRAQSTKLVMLAQRSDGSVNTILKEEDPAWVITHDDLHWVQQGKAFTWTSERDGWERLYRVSRDGHEVTCLTPGKFDIVDLLRVDEEGRWAYFIASPDAPAERYLYRVGLDGKQLQRLTPESETRGSHSYKISPDGKFAVWTASNADTPPVSRMVSLPDHVVLKTLQANKRLHQKVAALKLAPVEFFDVEIGDGIRLPALCLKPPHFDPSGNYPLLVYVYGEPGSQVVRDNWGRLWHLMLAQQGYVIMSFDNRGSRSPLGRTWRREAFKKIGILPPQDQAAAVRAVLKERSYLDPKRVGSWGWSGGGSMSLNAIFKYPDLYTTAIAVASVPDQRHYDTIYQERYMGKPKENRKAFREGSPINFAKQLKGNLLIMHGAADDNCHYQTYLKLVDELIRHNKQFSMMTYPRGTHSIKEGKNTRRHVYETMTRFLHDKLPANP